MALTVPVMSAVKIISEEAVLLHEGTKVEILDSVTTRTDSAVTKWYDVKIDNNTPCHK